MCSKVLNGHIILTDTSITTILAPEMTYTPKETLLAGGKIYRHTFRLDEQQQMQFENMMLKAGEPNKSKFIVGRIFG